MTRRPVDTPRPPAWPLVLGGFAIGITYFLYTGGAPALDPTNERWLMRNDWGMHHLGWVFFRKEPWHFPLGTLDSYPYPEGTNVIYSDSIPWVALLFKLFRGFLPRHFQYLGPWLALSAGLQGAFGARLVSRLARTIPVQLLGAALFVVAPPFLYRQGHAALGAHWLILWALTLHFEPADDMQSRRSLLVQSSLILAISAGVHAYLLAMVLMLILALGARLCLVDHVLRPKALLVAAAMESTLLATLYWVLGYGSGSDNVSGAGLGMYAADVLTFFNPMWRGRFLPTVVLPGGRDEGFAYLGGGIMLLVLAGLLGLVRRRGRPSTTALIRFVPLAIACALMAAMAFFPRVTVNGKLVADFNGRWWQPLSIFQGTGRFIWPLHYVVILVGIRLVVQSLPENVFFRTAALSVALMLQLMDQTGVKSAIASPDGIYEIPAPRVWHLAAGRYAHMVLYPPAAGFCPVPPHPDSYWQRHAFLADDIGATINSARLARTRVARQVAYCAALEQAVEAGRFEPNSIYILDRSVSRPLHANCGILDGEMVCVSSVRRDPFARALWRRKP